LVKSRILRMDMSAAEVEAFLSPPDAL